MHLAKRVYEGHGCFWGTLCCAKGKGQNAEPHTQLLITYSSGERTSGLGCTHPRDSVTTGLFARVQRFWRARLNSMADIRICKAWHQRYHIISFLTESIIQLVSKAEIWISESSVEDMDSGDSGPSRHNSLLKQHRGCNQLFSWLQRQTGIVCQLLLVITLSAQPPSEDLGTTLAGELLTDAQQSPLTVFMLQRVSGKQWADGGRCCSPMLSVGLKPSGQGGVGQGSHL